MQKLINKTKKFLKILGPGFITGASDDDPSGIATYAQTGAQFGYSQAWTAPFSTPFMVVIQEMCGRIGMVTGKGLPLVIKENYAKPILFSTVFLLFMANTINVGANLGAMASSGQLVFNLPFPLLLFIITIFTILLEVFVSYPTYARFLKYLAFALFAYVITALIIKVEWSAVILSTFIPHVSFSKEYLLNIVAILGTTISPYLFFWQAEEEVEEEIAHNRLKAMGKGVPKVRNKDIREMRLDTAAGMFFSNLVMWFIIITTATTLGLNNIKNIDTASQAAEALRPFAGDFAFLLFALGIIGTGLLSVPILAGSAAYALSEAFNLKTGLGLKFKQAHGFYVVLIIATLIGLFINFTPVKPFQMLYYTAVINGIVAPPLMILIMLIGNNKKIMKEHTNSLFSNITGWIITIIMSLASIALLLSFIL